MNIERVKLKRSDIELRLLYSNHFTNQSKFLIIRKLKGDWSGNFYEFDSQLISKTRKTRELNLSQNWKNAWLEIINKGYLDLLDEQELQKRRSPEDEFLIVADGESLGCEVVTKRSVNIFIYNNPEVKLQFLKKKGNVLSKYYEEAVTYFQLVYRSIGVD